MTYKKDTAGEYSGSLSADPEKVAMRARREAEHQATVRALHQEMEPVLAKLRALGVPVTLISDICGPPLPKAAPFPDALPVILAELQRDGYSPHARAVLASALETPETRAVGWTTIIDLYKSEPDGLSRTVLANVICIAVNESVIADVISLVRDPRMGSTRILLLDALKRSKSPDARATLEEMVDDPQLRTEIELFLKRRKKREASRSVTAH